MNQIELNQDVIDQIDKVSEAASYLWSREWAEGNGGNISIDLTESINQSELNLEEFEYVALDGFPEKSAGRLYFVTGTGERLRDLNRPDEAGCILRIDDKVEGYHFLWGGRGDRRFRPTSEFISHVKILLDKIASGSTHRCMIHTHPLELICLSHHPDYAHNEKKFRQACWRMTPEIRGFCSKGIGLVPYALPGSEKLADLTTKSLLTNDVVVWEKHGAVATGEDALAAFDFIDVANKGAKMFLKCLASGFIPEGLSDEQIDELVRVYNL